MNESYYTIVTLFYNESFSHSVPLFTNESIIEIVTDPINETRKDFVSIITDRIIINDCITNLRVKQITHSVPLTLLIHKILEYQIIIENHLRRFVSYNINDSIEKICISLS